MAVIKLTPDQIESWVARHFEYKRRKGGDEILICNPFVHSDNKFKFNISTVLRETKKGAAGYWVHDWRPSASQFNMSFIRFVQLYKNISFKEALKEICGEGIDLKSILRYSKPAIEEPTETPPTEIIVQLPPSALPIAVESPSKIRTIAINYLKSRCVSYELAVEQQIHYTGTSIVFPYLEYDAIVYWQSRSIIDKVFEFPDVRKVKVGKADFIYGFDNAEPHQPVYVAEAIFGALTIGPGGLATGGASMGENQRRKIRAINPSKVVLAPDNDEEGIASIYKNFQLISPYFETHYVLPPKPYKDWNDLAKSVANKEMGRKLVRMYIEKHAKLLSLREIVKLRLG